MLAAAGGAFDPKGPVAREIADLWWWLLGLGLLAFVIFAVVLVDGLVRRRQTPPEGDGVRPDPLILRGGVILPAVILSAVLWLTVDTMRALPASAPHDALTVDVIGHRWWWEVRYPGTGVVTANEIHIPAGRPVAFRLRSADVIHSFWIPSLGGKLDLLPEDVNTLVLEADEPGVHHSQCAEFCGLQHAKMGLVAVVETPGAFQAWLAQQDRGAGPPLSALARRGQQVFDNGRCATCHTIRGTAARGNKGPDLTHFGSRRTIAAATLPNTSENLERWITSPHDVKRGVAMPAPDLDADEIAAVLAYLEGLR